VAMKDWLERISEGWAILGGLILLSIVLATTLNVGSFALDKLARLYGANVAGLPGYEDFVRLGVSCAALMFFPLCQVRRGHVVVDIFTQSMPRRVVSFLDGLSLVLVTALGGFLAYWMLFGMLETRADGALSRVLGWPVWLFYGPGILSLMLWVLVAISQVSEAFMAAFTDG